MLRIHINSVDSVWNSETEEFLTIPETTLILEHSLASVAKWECKIKRAFASKKPMTESELLFYIKCMTLNSDNVDPVVYKVLTSETKREILKYIGDSMTATRLPEEDTPTGGGPSYTAEQIYCWMIECNIPFECQYWHLNRLMMLIKVCRRSQQPPKKRSMQEIMKRNNELNERRKKEWNTRG